MAVTAEPPKSAKLAVVPRSIAVAAAWLTAGPDPPSVVAWATKAAAGLVTLQPARRIAGSAGTTGWAWLPTVVEADGRAVALRLGPAAGSFFGPAGARTGRGGGAARLGPRLTGVVVGGAGRVTAVLEVMLSLAAARSAALAALAAFAAFKAFSSGVSFVVGGGRTFVGPLALVVVPAAVGAPTLSAEAWPFKPPSTKNIGNVRATAAAPIGAVLPGGSASQELIGVVRLLLRERSATGARAEARAEAVNTLGVRGVTLSLRSPARASNRFQVSRHGRSGVARSVMIGPGGRTVGLRI